MSNLVAVNEVENVLLNGDLSNLNPEQRVAYYQRVCQSLGLNPLTRPFDYITLNGKLTLYAKKDAADQLRRIYNISIDPPQIQFDNDWIIVTVSGHTPDGRSDSEVGVVNKKDMMGNYGNALMKAVTKAKRRLTLSICGLGWLDETEIDSIPDAKTVTVDVEREELPKPKQNGNRPYSPEKLKAALHEAAEKMKGDYIQAKDVNEVAACLSYVFLSDDKRHEFIRWLTGQTDSMKDLPTNMIAALKRWLKPAYVPEKTAYIPLDEYAAKEANAALEAYYLESGQLPLIAEAENVEEKTA